MIPCGDVLRRVSGGRVLDVGCGTGHFTRMLTETLRDVRSVVGIDPNKDSIDEARRNTEDRRITYRVLSAMDLVEVPERFDTVAIGYALHHVTDPGRVIERMLRVLVPGGTLIVSEPVSDGLSPAERNGRDIHHFKAAIDTARGLVHRPTLDREAVRDLVREHELEVLDECTGRREAEGGPSDPAAVKEAIDFLDEYLPFAEGSADYEKLMEERERLAGSIRREGIESPPHLVIVARKLGIGK